jgi:hypothetical protein
MTGRREFLFSVAPAAFGGATKKVVFVAGPPSHGWGQHAFPAGCTLLARQLEAGIPAARTTVCRGGWPKDESVFDGASAVVLYMDGGEMHPVRAHLDTLSTLVRKGTGVAALHYAVVAPQGAGDLFLEAIGGYYEPNWSVNPFWTAHFDHLPKHAVTRGVQPFALRDEWYFNMRFREGMRGVTPVLTATPPDAVRERPFGPHSGNPAVRSRKGMPEHVAWVYERPAGGRGFGLTGFHYHWAIGDGGFRNIVLNGIAWTAGLAVPRHGVSRRAPDWDELASGLEGARPPGFGPEQAREAIHPESGN